MNISRLLLSWVSSAMGMLEISFVYSILYGSEMRNQCSSISVLETIEFEYLTIDVFGSIASHIGLDDV